MLAQFLIFPNIIGLIPIGAIMLLVFVVLSSKRKASRSPFIPKQLLTKHEIAFFEKLVTAAEKVGAEGVFPQVAMGALIDARSGLDPKERLTTRNRFDRKIVDFVLVDAEMHVLAIVELDDRTHSPQKDAMRDAMTKAAGYITVRFRNGHRITVREIETGLRQALA